VPVVEGEKNEGQPKDEHRQVDRARCSRSHLANTATQLHNRQAAEDDKCIKNNVIEPTASVAIDSPMRLEQALALSRQEDQLNDAQARQQHDQPRPDLDRAGRRGGSHTPSAQTRNREWSCICTWERRRTGGKSS